jgi:hypothetical protein
MRPVSSVPAWTELDPALAARLPDAHARLRAGGLVVHPAVERVVLHGSRGLAGGYRPDSDLDLSLLVDAPAMERAALGSLLAQVIATTQGAWRGRVELDLVAVFDVRGCGLGCFDAEAWGADEVCPFGSGRDCFGAYKVQRGFEGFVEDAGIEVRRMQPSVTVWRRGATPPPWFRTRTPRRSGPP